MTAIIVNLGTR